MKKVCTSLLGWKISFVILCALLPILLIGSLLVGPVKINFLSIIDPDSSNFFIFWQIRAPRALVVSLTGALLAIGGLILQAIFRNDLCSPFTVGVSAAASLGVYVSILFFSTTITSTFSAAAAFGLIGALVSSAMMLLIAWLVRESSIILLLGICLNFFASSATLMLQYMSDPTQLFVTQRWLMGSFQGSTFYTVIPLLAVFLITLVVSSKRHYIFDLMLFGDDFVCSRGICPQNFRAVILSIVCVGISISVVCTGPIPFIGLLSPHIARCFCGELHGRLLPVTSLIGAGLLLGSDVISRVVAAPFEIPPGVITALLGVPGFIFLLLRNNLKDGSLKFKS
jgi:iron complex transport system permease protein